VSFTERGLANKEGVDPRSIVFEIEGEAIDDIE
jgi:hypothetical protein